MRRTKKILMLLITIVLMLSTFSSVSAAGSYSVSASASSVNIGTTISLTIKTTKAAGKFSVTSSNSGVVSVGTASVFVDGSESISLKAQAAGTATITITPQGVADDEYNMITTPKTVTITVKDNTATQQPQTPSTGTTTTKSSDATLKSITIGNKTYSGSSLKNTISYTANADVSSIKIAAAKNNSKASISGIGTKSLIAGQTNKFTITVTAEDGTKKTYNINIIRLAEETKEPNIIENETPVEEVKLALTSLVIKDVELNTEFNPEVYNYIANVQNMKELEIVATANKTDAQINIEGASDLKEGDNKVKITAILGEEKVEYVIDVYNTFEEVMAGIITDNNDNTSEDNNNFVGSIKTFLMNNIKEIILIGLIIVLGLIATRYVVLSYKYSKKINELLGLTPQENVQTVGINEVEKQKGKNEYGRKGRHF